MAHKRKDVVWAIPETGAPGMPKATLAVLMDLRDELKEINAALHSIRVANDVASRRLSALECPNFLDIPHTLRMIRVNTTKKRRVRKADK